MYRRRPFLRGVLDGAGVVVVVGVFFTVLAVDGGVFGVDEWTTGDDEAAIVGKPVGREGDVGTVMVPFREEAEVGGREVLSTVVSGREEDFARERVLLLSRLERVDIPCQDRRAELAHPTAAPRAKGAEFNSGNLIWLVKTQRSSDVKQTLVHNCPAPLSLSLPVCVSSASSAFGSCRSSAGRHNQPKRSARKVDLNTSPTKLVPGAGRKIIWSLRFRKIKIGLCCLLRLSGVRNPGNLCSPPKGKKTWAGGVCPSLASKFFVCCSAQTPPFKLPSPDVVPPQLK